MIYLADPSIILKRRRFSTPTEASLSTTRSRDSASVPPKQIEKRLDVPEDITFESLDKVFKPVEDELLLYMKKDNNQRAPEIVAGLLDAIRTVGARVLAMWSKDEIGDSGWKTGKVSKIFLSH